MSHAYILWIALFAYSAHIFEEFTLDWRDWATKTLSLPGIDWDYFYIANATVIITGISSAMVGWSLPAFGLIIPGLQIINGIFFHILPTILKRRISPGVFTSVILFLPIAIWAYIGAYQDDVLTPINCVLSFIFGGVLMSSPFIFLHLRKHIKKDDLVRKT